MTRALPGRFVPDGTVDGTTFGMALQRLVDAAAAAPAVTTGAETRTPAALLARGVGGGN